MNLIRIYRLVGIILLLASLIVMQACRTVGGGVRVGARVEIPPHPPAHHPAPPVHAPGHVHPRLYRYHYYPEAYVYFEATRGVYFYLIGDHWHASAQLPIEIRHRLGVHVEIEMGSPKPYIKHHHHRKVYPRGKYKKKKKKKKNGRHDHD